MKQLHTMKKQNKTHLMAKVHGISKRSRSHIIRTVRSAKSKLPINTAIGRIGVKTLAPEVLPQSSLSICSSKSKLRHGWWRKIRNKHPHDLNKKGWGARGFKHTKKPASPCQTQMLCTLQLADVNMRTKVPGCDWILRLAFLGFFLLLDFFRLWIGQVVHDKHKRWCILELPFMQLVVTHLHLYLIWK